MFTQGSFDLVFLVPCDVKEKLLKNTLVEVRKRNMYISSSQKSQKWDQNGTNILGASYLLDNFKLLYMEFQNKDNLYTIGSQHWPSKGTRFVTVT